MGIEIFGIPIQLNTLDLSDMVAAIALIVSIIIFVVGQLLVKRSEKQRLDREKKLNEAKELSQGLSVARDQFDRIVIRYLAYQEYMRNKEHSPVTRLELADEVLFECDYFINLWLIQEIKNLETYEYYSHRVWDFMFHIKEESKEALEDIGGRSTEFDRQIKRHNEIFRRISIYAE